MAWPGGDVRRNRENAPPLDFVVPGNDVEGVEEPVRMPVTFADTRQARTRHRPPFNLNPALERALWPDGCLAPTGSNCGADHLFGDNRLFYEQLRLWIMARSRPLQLPFLGVTK